MRLRCPTPGCGGSLFRERVDDSQLFAPTVPTDEYYCLLCSYRSTAPTPPPTSAEYRTMQAAEYGLNLAVSAYARKAADLAAG